MALAKYNGFVAGDTLPAENVNSINPADLKGAADADRLARVGANGKLPEGVLQMTNAQAVNLTNLADAKSLHHHLPTVLLGTRLANAASGAVNYAHGLGRIPKFVRITASMTGTNTCISRGYFDGTNQKVAWTGLVNSSSNTETGKVVSIEHNTGSGGSFYQRATIAWDATNITLTWTYNGSASGATVIAIDFEIE